MVFASTELISYVFANETDSYYGDDLIKRNLNQYLWSRLHQSYDTVYFLSAGADGFCIHTYGDQRRREFAPGKKKLFGFLGGNSAESEFGDWLQRQLRGKPGDTAAFVCPMEDFCGVLGTSAWEPVLAELAEMKNRTGIIVLTASATAEKTWNLLLESPVFEGLKETAVTDLRGGTMQKLYTALKKRKWDNCVFLNEFRWERLRAMLLHLVMEFPGRYESGAGLDAMTEYLYDYCRNPEFADGEGLFHREMPVEYLTYRNLYDRLREERVWMRFQAASEQYRQRERSQKAENTAHIRVPVLRDRNSYAGRCVRLRLPGWLTRREAAEEAVGLLAGIRDSVASPMNRGENPEIIAGAEVLLSRLEAVYPDDRDTYIWILDSLKFCVEHIYVQSPEETQRVLEIMQKQSGLIDVCQQRFVLSRDVKLSSGIQGEGTLHSKALQQMEAKLYTLDQLRSKYIDLISAMKLNLKMPASEESIQSMLQELEQELRHIDQPAQEPAADPVPEEQPREPDMEEEPEEEYIITPDMLDFKPHG